MHKLVTLSLVSVAIIGALLMNLLFNRSAQQANEIKRLYEVQTRLGADFWDLRKRIGVDLWDLRRLRTNENSETKYTPTCYLAGPDGKTTEIACDRLYDEGTSPPCYFLHYNDEKGTITKAQGPCSASVPTLGKAATENH